MLLRKERKPSVFSSEYMDVPLLGALMTLTTVSPTVCSVCFFLFLLFLSPQPHPLFNHLDIKIKNKKTTQPTRQRVC